MNKVKFKLKLTGLEMEFEGTREDMKQVSSNFGQQVAGLLQAEMNGATNGKSEITEDGEVDIIPAGSKVRKARKSRSSQNSSKAEKPQAVDFQNDVAAYGAPIQQWSAFDKAVWLLYVLEAQKNITELSAGEIGETFNKHFKQQGKIRPNNVSRDFGNKKAGANALVGENTSVFPAKWYLTELGKKSAQKLISDLKSNGVS